MFCQNCGAQNTENSRFCIKCGTPLNSVNSLNVNQPVTNEVPPIQQQQFNNNVVNNQPMNNQSYSNSNQYQNSGVKMSFAEYFKTFFAVILKPFSTISDEKSKFDTLKNSIMLSVIIAVFATLISLLKTMYSTVRVTTGGWFSEAKIEWVWENLQEIEYFKVIGINLLIFLGIIFAIAGVYYIAGLVVKKQPNFSRLLGVAAISVVPIVLCVLILSPLLSMIYAPLGMAITIVGIVYTLVIVYETMNNEIIVEGNAKYYFNLLCLSVLLIAGYYLYMKVFMASIDSGISDILDMFG